MASDLGSDIEKDSDEDPQGDIAEDEEIEEKSLVPRVACGTHVVYRTPYFYMASETTLRDSTMRIYRKWGDELGREGMSKTLNSRHYDVDPGTPTITHLALRAWMCWRAKQNNFIDKKAARQRWWESSVHQLTHDVRALHGPGGRTGSARADALFEQWCPAVFQL